MEAKLARTIWPSTNVVQPFQQQDGDQGCPNLDAQCVFAGTHEALHFEVLLETPQANTLLTSANGSSIAIDGVGWPIWSKRTIKLSSTL
jgi:hypothetical protein